MNRRAQDQFQESLNLLVDRHKRTPFLLAHKVIRHGKGLARVLTPVHLFLGIRVYDFFDLLFGGVPVKLAAQVGFPSLQIADHADQEKA